MKTESHTNKGIREMYAYRHRPENMGAFADFYWRTLLCAAFLTVVLSIGFGIVELSSMLRDFGSGADAGGITQPVPALNRAQLKSALENFQAREARFESLKMSAPEFTDPSK